MAAPVARPAHRSGIGSYLFTGAPDAPYGTDNSHTHSESDTQPCCYNNASANLNRYSATCYSYSDSYDRATADSYQ